jgi:hypothetical protein
MPTPKTNITATQPFSHGNVDAIPGRTYAMNSADAKELVKAGYATVATDDADTDATQNDVVAQRKDVGDVVVDDADDLLGDTKADKDLDNKAAPTTANKARATTTHKK